jgi:hypothetical protein
MYIAYLFITVVANVQVRSPLMLVFPFYSFLQTFVMPPVGAAHYLVLARRQRRLGRYRFGILRSPQPRVSQP